MQDMADATVSQSTNPDGGELPTAKKPYTRIITDKRREQNRKAQKQYREKLKRKLESLEEPGVSSAAKDNAPEEPLPESFPDESGRHVPTYEGANIINFDTILAAGGDISIPTALFATNGDVQISPLSPSLVPSSRTLTFHDEVPPETNHLPPWPMPSASTIYSPPPDTSDSYMSGSLTAVSSKYAYERQKAIIIRQPSHSETTQLNLPSSFGIPSLQPNSLRLVSESNLSASLAIGVMLGISHTAYLEDHPSPFPSCAAYLFPGATLRQLARDDGPQKFKDHMAMVKKPLRPSAAQMYYSHPGYLDCIIFPRFRERAVQASVEGTLDHVEFFLDLMHGGLVCWGSTLPGVTKRKRRRGIYDQVAWDTRSWEARRWFLDKWASLCGTEEEEERDGDSEGIWRSSRWWWAVRGELESDEKWSEDEEDNSKLCKDAHKIRRFETGVPYDATSETSSERLWAEGRTEVVGPLVGSGGFDLRDVVFPPPPDPGSERT